MKKKIISCGIDEAGRGALAGPLVVACVSFKDYSNIPLGVKDSKQTSYKSRKLLFKSIKKLSFISYCIISATIIDRIGIENATLLALKKTLKRNRKNIDIALVDGRIKSNLEVKYKNIIKGDSNYVSIAAASIIAKLIRDEYMKNLDLCYKMYGWKKNVGYGTEEHLKAIKKYGITKFHRKTYKPIREFLINDCK